MQKFANSPLLDSLTSLRMEDCRVTWEAVGDVVSSPRAAGLRALELSRVPSPPVVIATSPHMAKLRELRLRRASAGGRGFDWLFDSPHLNELRSLSVTDDDLSVSAAWRFARRTGLPALVELDLSHNRLDNEAAAVLADAPNLANLRRLNLTGNRIGKRAAALLRERLGDRVILDEFAVQS